MSFLIDNPPGWKLPESAATPESVYLNRRQILRAMGFGAASLIGASLTGCFLDVEGADLDSAAANTAGGDLYPAPRNPTYTVPERGTTPEELATRFNNFYEFTTNKSQVWQLVDRFETDPWSVEITGLVNRPQVMGLEDILHLFPLEERLYRFRCVEAWSMTVPWTGFPLSALINHVEPLSNARFVRMITVDRPSQMPGIDALPTYPWPYFEALRMDEAMNELTMIVTGLYGSPLPAQNGAPIRLIVPWKYGYKSIKSIVRIELVEEQPPTFWNTLNANEYSFLSNVNPDVPHPRWSQATERLLDTNEQIPTQLYNGYEEYVADLY